MHKLQLAFANKDEVCLYRDATGSPSDTWMDFLSWYGSDETEIVLTTPGGIAAISKLSLRFAVITEVTK